MAPQPPHDPFDSDLGFEITAPKPIGDIPAPRGLSDKDAVTHIEKSIDTHARARAKTLEGVDAATILFPNPVYVFHPDPSMGPGLCRTLRSAGCIDPRAISTISDFMRALRYEKADAACLWYDTKTHSETTGLLRELLQAREMERLLTLILCPGESSIQELSKQATDLLWDAAIVPPKQSRELRATLEKTRESLEAGSTLMNCLYKMRVPFRPAPAGTPRTILTRVQFAMAASPIDRSPGKKYWAAADTTLHSLVSGDAPAAKTHAEKLLADFPDELDAIFIAAAVKAKTEGIKVGADWLVKQAIDHRALNLEKCYQIARTLTRWKAVEALRELVEAWSWRTDIERDHQYSFFMGMYFGLVDDSDKKKAWLREAIKSAPLQRDYLLEYANTLESSWESGATRVRNALAKIQG
jgi:hypothetical protein